jgi:hypothetical protein
MPFQKCPPKTPLGYGGGKGKKKAQNGRAPLLCPESSRKEDLFEGDEV